MTDIWWFWRVVRDWWVWYTEYERLNNFLHLTKNGNLQKKILHSPKTDILDKKSKFLKFSQNRNPSTLHKIFIFSLYLPKQKFLREFLIFISKKKFLKYFHIYLKQKFLEIILYIYPEKILCTVASQKLSVSIQDMVLFCNTFSFT